jgi:hypothetical protein
MEHLPDFYDFLKFLYLFSKRDATILSPPGGAPAKNEKSDWQQVVIPAKAGIQPRLSFQGPGCRIESGMTTQDKIIEVDYILFSY